jgi:hypothetical protein
VAEARLKALPPGDARQALEQALVEQARARVQVAGAVRPG